MSQATTEAALRERLEHGYPASYVEVIALLDEIAVLRERPSSPEGADIDRMNNAADLIRRLLGYDDEPDESTAGMIYDAIEGDEDGFRGVLAMRPSDAALVEALKGAEQFALMILECDTYGCENGPHKCLHADAAKQLRTLRDALAAARADAETKA